MILVDNSEESKSLLKYFEKQFYNIDNENDIHNIKEICILTAYCYYEVFSYIIKNENARNIFLNAKVKILIGMNIDNKTRRLYFNDNKDNDKAINDFKEFTLNENKEYSSIIELFKYKCENKTLEIRKTAEYMHAKLYLFKYNEEAERNAFLIGSSNFTHRGIKDRKELNIYCKDGFNELYNYFEEEWNKAHEILNNKNEEEFFRNIIKLTNEDKKDKDDLVSPYKIFLKVIYEYFEFINREELLCSPADYGYRDYKYQIDAIKSGINGIMLYNGVLISDVVGLGKSIIASAIAKNLLLKEKVEEIIIICPPKIIDSWENYNSEFQIKAKVFSIGLLDKALEHVRNHRKNRLIIIDEAHRFVNNKTYSYDMITNICFGNKVIAITATPMHNTTSDIFSIIDIFDRKLTKNKNIEEAKIKILKEERELKSKYKKSENSKEENIKKSKEIAKEIMSLIHTIIIRRTRNDLLESSEYRKDLEKQKTEFNDVEEPKLHNYELGDLSKLYYDTLEKISPYNEDNEDNKDNSNIFKGVRYKPLIYLKKETIEDKRKSAEIVKEVYGEDANFDFADLSSNNIAKFMRHLLVRRFESSIFAFKKSVDNMIAKYENIKMWISKNRYTIYKRGDVNYEDYDDDNDIMIKDNSKKYEGLYIIENVKEVLSKEFFIDFENDLKILKEIKKDWENIGIEKDKKFFKLKEELKKFKKENDKRKIIIFSEFKDTVDYLYESICQDEELNYLLKPLKSVADSKNRETVKANFDASLEERKQESEYFLLISTDTLSEGVNLHRAGIIINYDIPYNPTRVIQRVGRINRIGKKLFDKIYIHNFIPRLEAQKDIKNWQISNFKLTLINSIFGNDTKILQKDDEINSLFSLKREAGIISDLENDISWDIEYREIYNKLNQDNNLLEEIKNMKDNIFIRRENDFNGLVEIRKGENGIFGGLLKNSVMDYNMANIFKILKAQENEKSFKPSDKAESLIADFERRKNIKKINYKPDALLKLERYKEIMELEISLNDREYIEKIIKGIEYNIFTEKQIKNIEKAFKNNNGIEILKEIKKIIDYSSLNYINYIESDYLKDSILVVREEFFK
ncbi:helicase [Brachyspira aalborgi]|uniref:Helicase n=1 Tax=Brachyspira aalborgi TaxID=29522 RepID=A0A5C8GCE5_9SPIR|nr:helicase-related protein [Brachyspira aalborgi]TXJ59560.1 helicase [Brachyspira aalborgi]